MFKEDKPMWNGVLFGGPSTKIGSNIFANVYDNQMHVAWLLPSGQPGGVGTIYDVFFFANYTVVDQTQWEQLNRNSQFLNNGGKTGGPAAEVGPVICAFSSQQHFGYFDGGGGLWDCWYDDKNNSWNYQRINAGPDGKTSAPLAAQAQTGGHPLCIWVDPSGTQQHFTYRATNGFIYDAFWNSNDNTWNMQQINGPGSKTSQSPAAVSSPYACTFHNQQHIAYKDKDGAIWDSWYDGSTWALQKINTPGDTSQPGQTRGPAGYPGNNQPFVWIDPKNVQQHFTYLGEDKVIYDAYWDSNANKWNLQILNGSDGIIPKAPTSTNAPFVSIYNDQQHVVYIDSADGAVWDIFYDGSGHWNLQKINSPANQAPGLTQTPASKTNGKLFVLTYTNEGTDTQNFFFFDDLHNIWWAQWSA
jgi:hypothetical protein